MLSGREEGRGKAYQQWEKDIQKQKHEHIPFWEEQIVWA